MLEPVTLIVAATEAELCGEAGLVCGVGPVEAAAATARVLAEGGVSAVLHVGLAGARRTSGIAVGALVVGASACYEDLVTTCRLAPDVVHADEWLVSVVAGVLGLEPLTIGTTGRVGGGDACEVEAMEGFAVLRACELAGVPAVEVRAISNHVEDARADWRIEEALAALGSALEVVIPVIGAGYASA